MRKEDVALVSAEENTGVEEYILRSGLSAEEYIISMKDIPKMIDLRDMDGASSLVVELLPCLTKTEVEIALRLMIRGFDDGTGTDWVPMGNALREVLRFLKAGRLTAGDMFFSLINGVISKIEKYTAAAYQSLIEINRQSSRGVAKVLDDNEFLSRALEVEKEMSWALEVAIADREDKSLSATVGKHPLTVNKLQEKLEKALEEKEAIAGVLQVLLMMTLGERNETARLFRRTIRDLLRGPVEALGKVLKKCRSAAGVHGRGGECAPVRPAVVPSKDAGVHE
jgi:hypothetical protein